VNAGGISHLDRPFPITFFRDFAAGTLTTESYTLRGLANRVRTVTASSKDKLPWLKLARFGEKKTPLVPRNDGSGRMTGGSLRNDDNVLEVTGIEADYDGEKIHVADAVEKMEKAGILAMVYTSPSHTADTPRWRVVCPTTTLLPPARREKLMGRLNGLFGGIFSGESWTLSQAYYFGSVNHNPSHEVYLVDGTPIDEHDDLDEIWLGKPATTTRTAATGERIAGPVDELTLLGDIISGASYHASAVRLLGRWARTGVPYMDARRRLLDAFDAVFPPERDSRWAARRGDVDRCLEDIYGAEARQRDQGKRLGEPPPHPGYDGPGPDDRWHDDPSATAPQHPQQPATDPEAAADAADAAESAGLRALLSVESWAERDIPEPDRLLGDLLTTTTRAFLVGRTGLGKTLLGLAMAAGAASGQGFLHWRSSRPARVLYLDGEMPAELIKPRARDAIRRLNGAAIPAGNLLIFGRDIEDEARRICPSLPPFCALNTDNGRLFLLGLIAAIGGVDLIVFDNVMSLIEGDQKDEVPWSATLQLVATLTDRRIGQLWLDHTGHNSDRQYGSSTKAWRFDAVGVMAPLTDKQNDPRATAFTLSFDHPGKSRRRTPDNWREFEATTITLQDDEWTSEPVEPAQSGKLSEQIRPAAMTQYKALSDALVVSPTPGQTTRDAWFAECVRLGLATAVDPKDSWSARDQKTKKFRTYISQLKVAGWIGVDGETVTDLRGGGK
jgi:hypothetical protein